MTEEEYAEARARLSTAIKDFYAATEPGVYVDDWVLVAHKDSVELTAEGVSVVGYTIPTGQPFHRTAGLLSIAQASSVERSR